VLWMLQTFHLCGTTRVVACKRYEAAEKGLGNHWRERTRARQGRIAEESEECSRMSDSAVRPPLVFSNITENDGPLRNKTN
jgi:hypothetical protein